MRWSRERLPSARLKGPHSAGGESLPFARRLRKTSRVCGSSEPSSTATGSGSTIESSASQSVPPSLKHAIKSRHGRSHRLPRWPRPGHRPLRGAAHGRRPQTGVAIGADGYKAGEEVVDATTAGSSTSSRQASASSQTRAPSGTVARSSPCPSGRRATTGTPNARTNRSTTSSTVGVGPLHCERCERGSQSTNSPMQMPAHSSNIPAFQRCMRYRSILNGSSPTSSCRRILPRGRNSPRGSEE